MIYVIIRRNNTLPTRTNFFISGAGKIESVLELKKIFSGGCSIADDSHAKVVWLDVVVFSKHSILNF